MKSNTISNEQRNVVRKMSEGYELFFWERSQPKTFHLNKNKSGEYGIEGSTVKKSIVNSIIERGLIAESRIAAGRVFYALTEQGRNLCR